MPRTAKDATLDSRAARSRLPARREPHWRSMSEGLAVGYRKGAKGGTWVARHYSADTGRRFEALGTADDVVDADGVHVFSFAQAQREARTWFASLARKDAGETTTGPYFVRDAMTDYIADYVRQGKRSEQRLRYIVDAHVLPALGDREVAKLSRRDVDAWFRAMASTGVRLRVKRGATTVRTRNLDADDPEAVRRRRATANRVLTVLKAALNHAHAEGKVATTDAWAGVKPYREVDAPKVRYLTDDEARRLVNAAPDDIRRLVTAALLTGCRYGELAAMKAADFHRDGGTVTIPRSKSGKARHVALTAEGAVFFDNATAGLRSGDIIFRRANGAAWKHSDQFRPMREACAAARIEPAISFHILRHTYGSRLAMRGVPMGVIAAQLGHADTRMTERHYAHLAPSYVADTVRATFGDMGLAPPSNVTTLAHGKATA
jgi:integrase